MPMTAAEKQKKYREKLKNNNPQKFEEFKKKAKERSAQHYQKKKSTYTEEDKEKLRQKWREVRKKVNDGNYTSASQRLSIASQDEPSTSQNSSQQQDNDSLIIQNMQRRIERKLKREDAELRLRLDILEKGFKNLQKKIYRQNQKMEMIQAKYNSILDKLATDKNTQDINMGELEEKTPRKKVEEFINKTIPNVETPKKEEVKKILLEHDVLTESLKNQFKSANNNEKNILKKVLDNDIVKKYKLKSKIRTNLGLKSNVKKYRNNKIKSNLLKYNIEKFFNRDDVSRATAGKKEYRTYKKNKRQKRYLLEKLSILHKKFISEEFPISFSTFKKYRPFYVLSPKIKDCESCACLKHSNMQFMVNKLKFINILKSDNLDEVVAGFVCDFNSKDCMYNKCDMCSEKKIYIDDKRLSEETSWFAWILKEYEYPKQNEIKKVKKMVKITKEGTLKDLLETFNLELKKFKTHIFNFYYQYQKYKDCINNLKDDEACIHIDFSENFTCKYHEGIQAQHFIKEQITLHTGVIYIHGKQKPISFCSISPDNQHNPEAIWTHLDPVLKYIKTNYPNISILHFFSDGPTTQYRQKKNFYFFSQKVYDYGFSYSTWSFFEAAHGKGPADGVGAVIKRTLDAKIAQGKDISDAKTAVDVLNAEETSVQIYYIPSIENLPIHTKLIPLQQTMKIHQLITEEKFQLRHRDLSCFCGDPRGSCDCHSPVQHSFLNEKEPNAKEKETKRRKVKRSQNSKKTKKRRISSSTEENESDIDIEYAESDDSVIFSDDAMGLESQSDGDDPNNECFLNEKTGSLIKVDPNKRLTNISETIPKKTDHDAKTKKDKKRTIICENEEFKPKRSRKAAEHVPVIFSDDAMGLESQSDGDDPNNECFLNEKTGSLIKIDPNKRLTNISETMPKKTDHDAKTKKDKKRTIICENEEFKPKRSRKAAEHVPNNNKITILSEIRLTPANIVSGDLRDSNIFRKEIKDALLEIRNKERSINQSNIGIKKQEENKENKNLTQENIAKTLETKVEIEKEYVSENIRSVTTEGDMKETLLSQITDNEVLEKSNTTETEYTYTGKCEEKGTTLSDKSNEIININRNERDFKAFDLNEEPERKHIEAIEEREENIVMLIERNDQYDQGKCKNVMEYSKIAQIDKDNQKEFEENKNIYQEEKWYVTEKEKRELEDLGKERNTRENDNDNRKGENVNEVTCNEQNDQKTRIEVTESEEIEKREQKNNQEKEKMENIQSGVSGQDDQEQGEQMIESEESEENDFNLNIKDSVIVRYFEKKTWKYYTGFIEKIEFKNEENHYKVKFLKTVKDTSDSVKFLVQRKLDIDIVTVDSIVKKVNLIQREIASKEYYLQKNDDFVLFT